MPIYTELLRAPTTLFPEWRNCFPLYLSGLKFADRACRNMFKWTMLPKRIHLVPQFDDKGEVFTCIAHFFRSTL